MVDPHHFSIRIYGEPMPDAKKITAKMKTRVPGQFKLVPIKRDFRERMVNGVKTRVDIGCFSAWTKTVQFQVIQFMRENGLRPFPKDHPIKVGMTVFLTKPPGYKLLVPARDPDWSNYWYAIENCLKHTPKKNGRPGMYPNGILFWDDAHVLGPLGTSDTGDKRWATSDEPPGVLIEVLDMQPILVERGLIGKTKERVTV